MIGQRGKGGIIRREKYLRLEDGVSSHNDERWGPTDPIGIFADLIWSHSEASGRPQPPYCPEGKTANSICIEMSFRLRGGSQKVKKSKSQKFKFVPYREHSHSAYGLTANLPSEQKFHTLCPPDRRWDPLFSCGKLFQLIYDSYWENPSRMD